MRASAWVHAYFIAICTGIYMQEIQTTPVCMDQARRVCVFVRVSTRAYMYVYVCVSVHTHTHTSVCVCVLVRVGCPGN